MTEMQATNFLCGFHRLNIANQLMIFALSENSATQELLHRRHTKLRVLWHAVLVEFVAHVIVADVDEYRLHDTFIICGRAYRIRQTGLVGWNNPGEECGNGSRLLHLAACGLLLWLPRSYWTDVDASGGHCAAGQRGSWEAFVNLLMARTQLCDHVRAKGIQARMLYNGFGRATVAEEWLASFDEFWN